MEPNNHSKNIILKPFILKSTQEEASQLQLILNCGDYLHNSLISLCTTRCTIQVNDVWEHVQHVKTMIELFVKLWKQAVLWVAMTIPAIQKYCVWAAIHPDLCYL